MLQMRVLRIHIKYEHKFSGMRTNAGRVSHFNFCKFIECTFGTFSLFVFKWFYFEIQIENKVFVEICLLSLFYEKFGHLRFESRYRM